LKEGDGRVGRDCREKNTGRGMACPEVEKTAKFHLTDGREGKKPQRAIQRQEAVVA